MGINRKKALIYAGLLLNFYLLPVLIRDTGSGILILLLLMPALTLVLSYGYGRNFGFNLVYSVLVAILFLPTIWTCGHLIFAHHLDSLQWKCHDLSLHQWNPVLFGPGLGKIRGQKGINF